MRVRGEQIFGIVAIVVGVAIVLAAVLGAATAWWTIAASLLVVGWLVYRWWHNARAWTQLEDESRR